MKVETYNIKSWKERQTGLLVAENEDWILVKHLPLDYLVDGYKLYRKRYVKDRRRKATEKQIEKVLGLKGVEAEPPANFEFGDILSVLKWSEETYGLFEFQAKDEGALFYGILDDCQDEVLKIHMVKSTGALDKEYRVKFKLDKIRAIALETDYFESVRLLMEHEQQAN